MSPAGGHPARAMTEAAALALELGATRLPRAASTRLTRMPRWHCRGVALGAQERALPASDETVSI